MVEHLHHYEEDDLFNPETHHEESDVNVRALLWSVVVFVIFSIFTWGVVLGFFKVFAKVERNMPPQPSLSSVARPAGDNIPAEPRLQPFPGKDATGVPISPNANTPVTDLDEMRATENKILTNYGWVDQQKGVVRIPIDQAKQLLLQRGLATQPAATSTAAAATATTGSLATTTASPSTTNSPSSAGTARP